MRRQDLFFNDNVNTDIMCAMKKMIMILWACLLFLTGCTTAKKETSSANEGKQTNVRLTKHPGDPYEAYAGAIKNRKNADSWSAAVNSTYTMSYSDDTSDIFILDGTLEMQNVSSDPTGHLTQHIQANGGNFSIAGDYYGGRLYNSYNDVTYYEDMKVNDLKKTLLVPMDPIAFDQDDIDSIQGQDDEDGNTIYTIVLNNKKAASIFSDRYDSYGLNKYDDYSVKSCQIKDTFDSDGYFVREDATFNTQVSYESQKVGVKYEAYVSYLKLDDTKVTISDDTKKKEKAYVSYKNIDTSKISTDTGEDDSPEDTVVKTFQKRLKNRLGYKENDDGTYSVKYNENESYSIDFSNDTFTYANYSIRYVYSWKGDTASMGACTYSFEGKQKTSGCDDKTIDMMKNVKSYLEMELYYCGLSLEDLQAETK